MRMITISTIIAILIATPMPGEEQTSAALSDEGVARFADLALECVHKEYPNKIAHVLQSDEDVKPPRELTPAFYGCYDWHSAVHGHWLLARLARLYPEAEFADEAREALSISLNEENIRREVEYIRGEGRASFERPYGLAWLLQLSAELREWPDPWAEDLAETLEPLEMEVVSRLETWLPRLAYPIRTGEHSQTAFAFGLMLDWARTADHPALEGLLEEKIVEFYLDDEHCPLEYEPSGQDFLSPCIAEADVVRRILPPDEYAPWLSTFLPEIPTEPSGEWLPVGIVTDRSDGKLAHLDGLNLSRAWMLEGIAAGLSDDDPRVPALLTTARVHANDALRAVDGEHYEGGHWLGSFATYLVTERGID